MKSKSKGYLLPVALILIVCIVGIFALNRTGSNDGDSGGIFQSGDGKVTQRTIKVKPGYQIYVQNENDKYNSCGLTGTGTLDGRDIGLTAGHCGKPGQEVYNSRNVLIGTVYENGFVHPSGGPSDWAIIDFKDNIELDDDESYTTEAPEVGDRIEFDGHATGESEGYVEEPGVINYDLISEGYREMTGRGVLTSAAVNPTDSGSPVKNGEGSIIGLVSAATSSGNYGSGKMIMTSLEDILESFRSLKGEDLRLGGGEG